MSWSKRVVAALLIGVMLLPVLVGSAAVAEETTPFINYTTVNNTLIVNTLYYDLTFNATLGGIDYLKVKNDVGDTYTVLNNSKIPLLGLAVNGSILRPANISIVGSAEDNLLVAVAVFNYENATVKEYIQIPSWTPQIAVTVISSSPINSLTIVIPVESGDVETKALYTYASQGAVNTSAIQGRGVHNITGDELPLAYAFAGVKSETSNNTTIAILEYFIGLAVEAPIASYFEYNNATVDNTTYYVINVTYTNISTLSLRLVPTNYLPGIISLPPLAYTLNSTVNISHDINIMARLKAYLNDLKERIKGLNETINNLQDRLKDVQKDADFYKGEVDHYKQELAAAQHQVESLKSRLNKAGIVEIAVFIVGVIIGIIGGNYIVRYSKK